MLLKISLILIAFTYLYFWRGEHDSTAQAYIEQQLEVQDVAGAWVDERGDDEICKCVEIITISVDLYYLLYG